MTNHPNENLVFEVSKNDLISFLAETKIIEVVRVTNELFIVQACRQHEGKLVTSRVCVTRETLSCICNMYCNII